MTKYWTTETGAEGSVFLPADIEFNSSINYMWRQKTDVFGEDRNVVLWNAYLAKKFPEKENG
ncbi:hypothetical protein, partial [Flavihumibacter sp. CACIAM 22H1]|uniref:hypothetical protein n=1 Tax=Flavihumibacter sp. CACIAM 22H1 TaxID=1812911 RepID=UPI0025BFF287